MNQVMKVVLKNTVFIFIVVIILFAIGFLIFPSVYGPGYEKILIGKWQLANSNYYIIFDRGGKFVEKDSTGLESDGIWEIVAEDNRNILYTYVDDLRGEYSIGKIDRTTLFLTTALGHDLEFHRVK